MNVTKQGFTLAELLAVVIILGLMTTFGVGYYKKSVAQARFSQVVSQASREIASKEQARMDLALQGRYTEAQNACEVIYKVGTEIGYVVQATPACIPTGKTADTFPRGRIACIGTTDDGKALCQSVGYINCSTEDVSVVGSPYEGKPVCVMP